MFKLPILGMNRERFSSGRRNNNGPPSTNTGRLNNYSGSTSNSYQSYGGKDDYGRDDDRRDDFYNERDEYGRTTPDDYRRRPPPSSGRSDGPGRELLRFIVVSKRIRPYGIVEIMLQAVMNRIERIAMVFGVVKMVNVIHSHSSSSRGMADKALRIVAIRDTATIGTTEKGTVLHPINGVVVVVTNQSRLVYHMVVQIETLLPIHETLKMPGIM